MKNSYWEFNKYHNKSKVAPGLLSTSGFVPSSQLSHMDLQNITWATRQENTRAQVNNTGDGTSHVYSVIWISLSGCLWWEGKRNPNLHFQSNRRYFDALTSKKVKWYQTFDVRVTPILFSLTPKMFDQLWYSASNNSPR